MANTDSKVRGIRGKRMPFPVRCIRYLPAQSAGSAESDFRWSSEIQQSIALKLEAVFDSDRFFAGESVFKGR